jgi:cysteine synthase A
MYSLTGGYATIMVRTTSDMTATRIADNVTELIGNTPMVRLSKFNTTGNAELIAKLEMFNPLSSAKDRIALAMIEDAEQRGLIVPHRSVIVEPTSGNTGISIAFIAAYKGYKCVIVLPESMSIERRNIMTALGAEVILTPSEEGLGGALRKAKELADTIPNAWMPLQTANRHNPLAHYETTGKEIWNDCAGRIDVFVCGVGTGGTITGVGRFLKSKNPDIRIIAVQPEGSPILTGGQPGKHDIPGLLGGFISETTDVSLFDEVISVRDEDAIQAAKRLAREEGLFAGVSSGAAAWAAALVCDRSEMKGKIVVTLFPDSGERYLSLPIWR